MPGRWGCSPQGGHSPTGRPHRSDILRGIVRTDARSRPSGDDFRITPSLFCDPETRTDVTQPHPMRRTPCFPERRHAEHEPPVPAQLSGSFAGCFQCTEPVAAGLLPRACAAAGSPAPPVTLEGSLAHFPVENFRRSPVTQHLARPVVEQVLDALEFGGIQMPLATRGHPYKYREELVGGSVAVERRTHASFMEELRDGVADLGIAPLARLRNLRIQVERHGAPGAQIDHEVRPVAPVHAIGAQPSVQ